MSGTENSVGRRVDVEKESDHEAADNAVVAAFAGGFGHECASVIVAARWEAASRLSSPPLVARSQ